MNNVTELNKLAEKITGTNPNATIDAKAVKFIADNYEGGNSGGDYQIYLTENPDTTAKAVTDENLINMLNKIKEDVFDETKMIKPVLVFRRGNETASNYRVFNDFSVYYSHLDNKIEFTFGSVMLMPSTVSSTVNAIGFYKSDNSDTWYIRRLSKSIN